MLLQKYREIIISFIGRNYAKKTTFQKIVVHGMLLASFLSRMEECICLAEVIIHDG